MRKRSSLIWIGIVVVVLAVVLVLYKGHQKDESKASAAERPSSTPAARVVAVKRGAIEHVLTLAGQFQPYQVVDVHAKVAGYIKNIYVDIGDKVHAGETLAILEVPELNAQLQETVAEAQRAREEITRETHEVQRTESVHAALHADYTRLIAASKAQPGLIAQQELDNAQAKDLSSEAQIDAAKSALAAAKQQAAMASANRERVNDLNDYTHVVSPLNGVVIWRYADTGALIQAGTSSEVQSLPVVKVSQSDLLRLRVPVPESAVAYVHVGQPMQVRVDAVNRSFTGMVVRFTRNVSLDTRTMETEIDVPNKDLSLTPGMYANTMLELAHHSNILTVPVEAVMKEGDDQVVLVVNQQNKVEKRVVQVGIAGSHLVEIKSGVQEGDRVIDGGQGKYEHGETVDPQLAPSPNNDIMHEAGSMIDLNTESGGAE
ncbi:efflux RND transporter periplasmic adaptor subunit [Acidipila rosea]|uniref:RND family efflux transporter MFP subunit n=1 Tax=Acidipila rosea TaxID=768535 RepID=A0A4R1L907_9BACT|nr:efflux RND transporter periplasmic adaptor subunit [Acidipila rosea]MBW4043495.1 efflux RND transporter periplasmic adaptor subunit [Acidobacteriota bacterium]TCK73797.1 RND family efflux transporter MFP subunit [Acidipila rosea]